MTAIPLGLTLGALIVLGPAPPGEEMVMTVYTPARRHLVTTAGLVAALLLLACSPGPGGAEQRPVQSAAPQPAEARVAER